MLPPTLAATLLETLALKDLARAGWLRAGKAQPESVAAHSWGVAWLVLALCPEGLDRGRALAIAVVHDLAETRVGDLTPYDGVPAEEKRRRELEAFTALVAPFDHARELLALFLEYEEGSTKEGRFVKACDKLDLGFQARRYAAEGFETTEFLCSAKRALDAELAALLDP